MVDYGKSRVYRIVNHVDELIYIGSTTQPLSKRMTSHRSCARKNATNMRLHEHMRNIGIDHFRIELIEMFPCENIEQLRAREGHYILELKPELNKVIAGRTRKETNEAYYRQNRTKLRQANECECGGRYTYDSKSQHLKTQIHQTYLANLDNPCE